MRLPLQDARRTNMTVPMMEQILCEVLFILVVDLRGDERKIGHSNHSFFHFLY